MEKSAVVRCRLWSYRLIEDRVPPLDPKRAERLGAGHARRVRNAENIGRE
jgi:hypothetical protein